MIAQILWHSPTLAPASLAALFAICLAVGVLYPPQLRGLPTLWRYTLFGLRITAMTMITVSLLQPAVLRPKTIAEKGAVVALIDRSRSMNVSDNARSPAQRVALADALGALPAGARSQVAAPAMARVAEMRSLADQVERVAGEADYAALSGRGADVARQRLEQVTQKLTLTCAATAAESPHFASNPELAAALATFAGVPPKFDAQQLKKLRQDLEQSLNLLTTFQSTSDAAIYGQNPQIKTICDELSQRSRSQLTDDALQHLVLAHLPPGTPVMKFAFAGDLARIDSATTQPTQDLLASRTDLSGALRSLQDYLIGRPVQAIVILSDGRQTRSTALNIPRGAAPVFAVCAAPPTPALDIAISRIVAPYSVFAGEPSTARVELRGSNVAAAKVDVSIETEGVVQTQPVTFAQDSTAAAEFPIKFASSGVQKITVRTAGIPGELTLDNNTSQRWIKVLTEKVPVTIISGTPSWDAQYLRGLLSRTLWITLRDIPLTSEAPPADMTPAQLLEQGVVLLLDVAPSQLSSEQWNALRTLVHERGGSVIILAGDEHGAPSLQRAADAGLLPFDAPTRLDWRLWRDNGRYFQIDEAPDAPANTRWPVLAPIARYLSLPKLHEGARPLLVERETEAPILIESRADRGRLFFLGTDESWRWRQTGENENRFWQQLIRYACDEPYAAHRGNAWLDVDNFAAEPGQAVRVRAKVAQSAESTTQPAVRLQMIDDAKVSKEIALKTTGSAGQYEATLQNLPRGQYTLRLTAGRDEDSVALPLQVAETDEAELADLSPDERVMKRAAESSGGELLRLDQANTLPQKLAAAREAQSPFIEYPLWDSPYLFVFLLGVLGAEWSLRKRLGLA